MNVHIFTEAPAGIWTASLVAGVAATTMYPATRTTMIDRRENWSLSCVQLGMHTHFNALEKPHDRQVCAAASPNGTSTGGNGLAHYKGQRAICVCL